jgi:hypothetical protein
MTKWEADYPFYHTLEAGPIKATVAQERGGVKAYLVGTIDEEMPPNISSSDSAKSWCKDELRKIRDKINEALEEE